MDLSNAARLFLLIPAFFTSADVPFCPSIQYLKKGAAELINCSFREEFFAVLWYNSTDTHNNEAVAVLQQSVKSGIGYESGEFDIYPTGSLIIKNVTRQHDGVYTVLKLQRDSGPPAADRFFITVVILANSISTFPVIEQCRHRPTDKICVLDWKQHSEVTCFIEDAPLVVSLIWFVKTIDGDRNVSSDFSVTNQTYRVTSSVTTRNPFLFSSWLAMLTCRANSPPGLLQKNESHILLLDEPVDWTPGTPIEKYLELGSSLSLKCSKMLHVVWQVMKRSEDKFDIILYATRTGNLFLKNYDDDYGLDSAGSLVASDVSVEHEGLYRCISSNLTKDNVILYNVTVLVSPTPNHPIIEGCNHEQYCGIEAQSEGSLTCTVKRIRPPVKLDLKTFNEEPSLHIYDKFVNTSNNGDAYDISLTVKYRAEDPSKKRITLECKAVGGYVEHLHSSTKFDVFLTGELQATVKPDGIQPKEMNYWIILVAFGIVLIIIISTFCTIYCIRRVYWNRLKSATTKNAGDEEGETVRNYECIAIEKEAFGYYARHDQTERTLCEDEVIPLTSEVSVQDKRGKFITALQSKYEDFYKGVQPLPYIQDRRHEVDKMFVEVGITYLNTTGTSVRKTWERLETYQSIFTDSRVKSSRRILEGDPGYGKSTVTLQLAYDWCNRTSKSALSDVDILILLRLRQLGGVKSIYSAIKRFLLPKDFKLTENDIEEIMGNDSSILVVLDGFDEYPDQLDSGNESDILSIIMKKMFQHCDVILTTRSSCLPKSYPPTTKRIKLTGFDDRARSDYILKAIVVEHDLKHAEKLQVAENIQRRLNQNPVLKLVCQVPLFLVLYAHMSHEDEQFQQVKSVTTFLLYIITCLHAHMRNKLEDENVERIDTFETDHRKLDEIAFKGLISKDQQNGWKKDQLLGRLGEEFYHQYVKIGILVEEDVLEVTNKPSTSTTPHIQYKVKVRFYHTFFCEWYAAHYLADCASRDEPLDIPSGEQIFVKQGEFKKLFQHLHPLNFQYLYRFACGINSAASEKIIKCLKENKELEIFVSMCILEHGGQIENLLHTVKELFSNEVTVSSEDTILWQISTVQLLEIASNNSIPISSVKLLFCFPLPDSENETPCLKKDSLSLSSHLQLPRLDTLQELVIDDIADLTTTAEVVLEYSSRCGALCSVKFSGVLLPKSFVIRGVLATLYKKKCKVSWDTMSSGSWHLNLEVGTWEKDHGGEVTDQDYTREVKKFEEKCDPNEESADDEN